MKPRPFSTTLIATMAVMTLVLTLGSAAVLEAKPGASDAAATMTVGGGNVSFSVAHRYGSASLSVAGGGYSFKQSFNGNEAIGFAPVDAKGYQLPNGTYKWELTFSPREQDLVPSQFKSGEVGVNGRSVQAAEAPAMPKAWGAFTILNGTAVDPFLVEPESSVKMTVASETLEDPSHRSAPIDQDGQ